MDSRVRLLCYPRGSFYPLSSRPPTWPSRITKTCFRTSSSRRSHYQAGLCLCTFSTMSIRTKPTFVSLRYSLARYRPSKTAYLALYPNLFAKLMGKPHTFKRVVLHLCSRRAQEIPITKFQIPNKYKLNEN